MCECDAKLFIDRTFMDWLSPDDRGEVLNWIEVYGYPNTDVTDLLFCIHEVTLNIVVRDKDGNVIWNTEGFSDGTVRVFTETRNTGEDVPQVILNEWYRDGSVHLRPNKV